VGQVAVLSKDSGKCVWIQYGCSCDASNSFEVNDGSCARLAKSCDGGRTWSHVDKLPEWMNVDLGQRVLVSQTTVYSVKDSSALIKGLPELGFDELHSSFEGCRDSFPNIELLDVNPHNAEEVYVGVKCSKSETCPPGLYRSLNGGRYFSLLSRFEGPSNCGTLQNEYALSIDPFSPSNILYGLEPARLLRSSDSGRSWSSVGPRLLLMEPIRPLLVMPSSTLWEIPSHIGAIAHDPRRQGHVFAASNKGLLFSNDGGCTFTIVNIGVGSMCTRMSLVIGNDGDDSIYVGSIYGLFISHSGGEGWTQIELPLD
jgi:hypothetical protein